jgi:hypothetical protein
MSDNGRCGARNRNCRRCGHRYPASERPLEDCPECGELRRCRSNPVNGSKRCRMHGGKTPRGIASVEFETGRYSRSLPGRLVATYETALQDADLITLRNELALLQARLHELLGSVDTAGTRGVWAKLGKAQRELDRAWQDADSTATAKAIHKMGVVVGDAATERAAWREVYEVVEQLRRLSESERRRLVDLQQMITAEQLMAYTGALLALVKENVTDPTILSNIGAGVRRLVSVPDRGRA